jgi:AcrR family transcriptional regulator
MPPLSTRKPGRPRDQALRAQWREQILDAAGRIFAKRGFSKTDLEIVAQQIGVSKGTIYRYFRSKSALFLAAVDAGMQRLDALIDQSIASADDPLQGMQRAVRAYLEFFDANPYIVELFIQERAFFRDRKKPTYFIYRERNHGKGHELARQLTERGRIRNIPPQRLVTVLGELLYGAMFTNYFAGREQSVDDQFRDIMDIVLFGILSETERGAAPTGD